MVVLHLLDASSGSFEFGEVDLAIPEDKEKTITAAEVISMVKDLMLINNNDGWLVCGGCSVDPRSVLEEECPSWSTQPLCVAFPPMNGADGTEPFGSQETEADCFCAKCQVEKKIPSLERKNRNLESSIQSNFDKAVRFMRDWCGRCHKQEKEATALAQENANLQQALEDSQHSLQQAQDALQKSQKTDNLWNILVQSLEKETLDRIILEAIQNQEKRKEASIVKRDYYLAEVIKYDTLIKDLDGEIALLTILMAEEEKKKKVEEDEGDQKEDEKEAAMGHSDQETDA